MIEYPQIDTYEQFLEMVPKDDWFVIPEGPIRRGDPALHPQRGCQCPISSLNGLTAGHFASVSYLYGMSTPLMYRIVRAADRRTLSQDYPTHASDRAALIATLNPREVDV